MFDCYNKKALDVGLLISYEYLKYQFLLEGTNEYYLKKQKNHKSS